MKPKDNSQGIGSLSRERFSNTLVDFESSSAELATRKERNEYESSKKRVEMVNLENLFLKRQTTSGQLHAAREKKCAQFFWFGFLLNPAGKIALGSVRFVSNLKPVWFSWAFPFSTKEHSTW